MNGELAILVRDIEMTGISIAAVGDIMLGDHPVCFGHGIRSTIRRQGFEFMIRDAVQEMLGHDLVFGNLECVLSDVDAAEDKVLTRSELRGDKKAVGLLQACGFNVVSVANNHMLQHGIGAFRETVDWLAAHQIQSVGLYEEGRSNVIEIERSCQRLFFLGFSLRPEHFCKDNKYYAHGSTQEILQQIRDLRAQHVESSIVVSLHWGEEYLHVPSGAQIELAHAMVDAGATLLLGHHPHVLQGLERYRDGLIAYSLGNFVFDSWQKPTREAGVLKCKLDRGVVTEFSLAPLSIRSDFAVTAKDAADAASIHKKVQQYSDAIANRNDLASIDEASYDKIAAKAYLRYRLECYWYFVTHFWRYEPSVLFSSLFRSVLRRAGLV